jgi:hypothetical protein
VENKTFGPAFDKKEDGERVNKQHVSIREYMLVAGWKSLADIEKVLSYPQASISAQLRHLRKPVFGGYQVEKRRVGSFWEYKVSVPPPDGSVQCKLELNF